MAELASCGIETIGIIGLFVGAILASIGYSLFKGKKRRTEEITV